MNQSLTKSYTPLVGSTINVGWLLSLPPIRWLRKSQRASEKGLGCGTPMTRIAERRFTSSATGVGFLLHGDARFAGGSGKNFDGVPGINNGMGRIVIQGRSGESVRCNRPLGAIASRRYNTNEERF
jgi:hypothetical protein